jgi:quinol monooxygenase YgiN
MSLYVVAHIRAKQDKQEEMRDVLTGLIAPTRKEAGCIRYELFRNNADPQEFTFMEEWVSETALEAHLQTPHLKSALASFPSLGEGAPAINRYSLIS